MKKALFALLAIAPFAAWPAFAASHLLPATSHVVGTTFAGASTFGDPAVITSSIEAVTVYPGQAMVQRKASAPGSGSYVFPGLPDTLQVNSVRVRGEGMEVMGVEVRDRWVAAVANARLAEIDTLLQKLGRELKGMEDEQEAERALEGHYVRLLDPSPQESSSAGGDKGTPTPEAWGKGAVFLAKRLLATRHTLRELGWAIEDKEKQIQALRMERSRGASGAGHRVFDVLVELDAAGAGEVTLEYIVLGAGWTPVYDLRADAGLTKVELTYRAEVLQQTGEDWDSVNLSLSTSQPEFGAQAPDLLQSWMNLFDPEADKKRGRVGFAMTRSAAPSERAQMEKGLADRKSSKDAREAFDASAFFAAVQSTGASLRYSISRPESIPSRQGTSRVLVGRADLKVNAEHVCVPSLDEKVWLRAMTTNTSPWVMLPGSGSVYFGGDYVGLASLDSVRLGEEFALHLGVDPGVKVERIALEKNVSTSGFFGSRTSVTAGWRIRFENVGAVGTQPDGSVDVIVRESLPRSTSEDLSIEVDLARPALSTDKRWKQDREEKGFLTWNLNVPKASEAAIEWRSKMTFPEDMKLTGN